MFDINDEKTTRVSSGDPWDRIETADQTLSEEEDVHPLDTEENTRLFRRLVGYYQQELDRQHDNRIQQAIDADFYDSIQWSEEDAAKLRERGQAPLVYNVIKQSVNWVIGSEKRGRTDFRILPREKSDAKPAERKTQLLKYLSDCNRTQFHRSRSFEDAVKVGIGWMEDGVQDDDGGEPLYSRYENWRNILWDSASTELDLSDCRYICRSKWIDIDIAEALFPDRADLIRKSAIDSDKGGFDIEHGDEPMDSHEYEREIYGSSRHALTAHDRERVRLIEIWFRKPVEVERIIAGQFAGEEYDPDYPGHQQEVAQLEAAGKQVIASRVMMKMHVAIMTTSGLLYVETSPYRHNRFPFTPIWGYKRDRDGLPYGMIRDLRDIQDDINKRASKALYILSSNKIVMDDDAVEDVEELREEAAKPNAVIKKRKGSQLDLNADRELAAPHLELMARGIQMIQQVGGVTDENMGRETNATSGRAIEARQDQGSIATSKFFDNLRFAFQAQGEIQLSLIEQYFTEEKRFRITNERGKPDYVAVNDSLPENDITRTKADFVISEGEWRASIRQAQAEQLMEMMTRLPPEVSMVMLDMVIESMDLPNRDELVSRIRRMTGQSDPDAEELTPEERQAQAQRMRQQKLQEAQVQADIREKLAKAGKTEAEAQRVAEEIVRERMGTQADAVSAGRDAAEFPLAIDIADNLLREAGYESAPEKIAKAEQQAVAEARADAQAQDVQRRQAEQEQAEAEQEQGGAVPEGAALPPQEQPQPRR